MVHPRQQVVIKFCLLCLILLVYFIYLTIQYDLLTGGIAALITWSFFVLCRPIADAGFLLDFPLRLLFGIRMVVSETFVWAIAISINVLRWYILEGFTRPLFTQLMQVILTTPYPYWSVIFLSFIGTFLSIRFGDELMDVLHHKDRHVYFNHYFKHELLLFIFFLLVIFGCYEIISSLGIVIENS
jgi:hypothetical protein